MLNLKFSPSQSNCIIKVISRNSTNIQREVGAGEAGRGINSNILFGVKATVQKWHRCGWPKKTGLGFRNASMPMPPYT